jgi:hypothetical protein
MTNDHNNDGGFRGSLNSAFRTTSRLYYVAATKWTDENDRSLTGTKMLVWGVDQQFRSWFTGKLEIKSEKPLGDIEALNSKIPQEEWKIGPSGQREKPWKYTVVVKLINPDTGEHFEFANSTWGAIVAHDRLCDQVIVEQEIHGDDLLPEIVLSELPMKSKKWNTVVMRPHFEVVGWKHLRGRGNGKMVPKPDPTPQLTGPMPATPPASASASSPTPATSNTKSTLDIGSGSSLGALKDPESKSWSEILDDDIPSFD